jgi:hypothetical protein
MAELVQQRKTIAAPAVSMTLALALLGGIAGGAVAIAVPAVIEARADGDAARAAEREKWLAYGRDWEARYRQMYPIID